MAPSTAKRAPDAASVTSHTRMTPSSESGSGGVVVLPVKTRRSRPPSIVAAGDSYVAHGAPWSESESRTVTFGTLAGAPAICTPASRARTEIPFAPEADVLRILTDPAARSSTGQGSPHCGSTTRVLRYVGDAATATVAESASAAAPTLSARERLPGFRRSI